MFIFDHFNILLRIFYCYGLAPISVIKIGTNLRYRFFIVPAILMPTLSICIAVHLLNKPHLPYGSVGIIINYLTILFSVLMTITATGQCILHKSIYHDIIQQTQQITTRFTVKFSTKMSLKSLKLRYRLKVLLLLSLFFLSQGLVVVEVWLVHPNRSLWLPIVNALLRSVFPIVILHFILYIDIVVLMVQELNQQVRNSANLSHQTSRFEFLKNMKLLHKDIWLLVVQINIFFGWSLLCVTIYSFIYITKQLYFIFTVLYAHWDLLAMIEGLVSVSYGVVALSVFVNACQSPSLEIQLLIENIEQYVIIGISDKAFLQQHLLRQDLLSQITHLCINITASDFFVIDRKFLAGILANCCMYIIIFIQFFLAAEIK